jgi:uncharacterized repeat protein (TIGR03803 family)
MAGLLIDRKTGALYGTTALGGAKGNGTIFKLTPSGDGYTESLLYSFRGTPNDGAGPYGALVADRTGALYGTTSQAGSNSSCDGGCGTVFKLTFSGSAYTETVLHSFQGEPDGARPYAALIIDDKTGTLYGTTTEGGQGPSPGYGTVFELSPSEAGYTESILHSFGGKPDDGANPQASLIEERGELYGTTSSGGTYGAGTVFKMVPAASNYSERLVYSFQGGTDGAGPVASLIDVYGALYGTTYGGGTPSASQGTVFELTR